MKKIMTSLLLVSVLAACATQVPKPPIDSAMAGSESFVIAEPIVVESPAKSTEQVSAPTETINVVIADPLNDQNSLLSKRSVYYPFDVSDVQHADIPVVQAHAKYLSEHANRKIRLEGNCDERGSDEYNLALGQRRAEGVKKMLQAGGVNERQIETVSYGAEKPKATGHDESSWSQNRRTDLNYK